MHKPFTRDDALASISDETLIIPEGYTQTEYDFAFFVARSDLARVSALSIPSSLEGICTQGEYSGGPFDNFNSAFERILVAKDNEHFASHEGVLYSKDMTRLIWYPQGKLDDTLIIPEGVKAIESGAFRCANRLKKVLVPGTLKTVELRAFSECANVDFPQIAPIYKTDSCLLLSVPFVEAGRACELNGKRTYWKVLKDRIEKLDKSAFDALALNVSAVLSYEDRYAALKHVEALIDGLYWLWDDSDQALDRPDNLIAFMDRFYMCEL